MNMITIFEKYNQMSQFPNSFVVLVLCILAATYIITTYISKKHNLDDSVGFFSTMLMFVLISIVTISYDTYKDYTTVKPFVKDVQVQISKKLDVEMTYKQTEKLLKEQPTWANHLTKEDLDNKK